MQTREWALVAFSLLMQSSVGTLVVTVALALAGGRGGAHAAHAMSVPFAIAAATGILALGASLLHLGHPSQAWLVITNTRASWLSREIFASLLFVTYAIVLVIQRRDASDASSVLAAVLGLFVVYAMARLYMVPAQPATSNRPTAAGIRTPSWSGWRSARTSS